MSELEQFDNRTRIIQESVPGRQVTLAHVIASPDEILYEKLGLDPRIDYAKAAIGVSTVVPSETAIIMADIALKASGVTLGFVDRFSGSLIITGTVSEVLSAMEAMEDYVREKLGYTVCPITKT
ncbi:MULTISPECIES: BMC domain-containing protein [Agathobacter]|uniref:BMC domain-containing protein n=1 Tax=Agathobacter ruminis TaxID=1712665 RepID=A0A2G3E6F5_9FIRM|nr:MULTISPECIES: BMC domain-containing protein [Agathobacter]MBQ1681007.1 BMC domain-containing protein [Agathobacter sp.]MCR5676858.1 BMC domain-containing protein [Agathobacter sp.]MDC7301698.1 BMC domain-containing protein [Agathobacter ruminis]PHU38827.1 BMC domain-containing protein [Agathobacter ruminis]